MFACYSPNPTKTGLVPFHEASWWETSHDHQNLPYCMAYHTVQYFIPPNFTSPIPLDLACFLAKQPERHDSSALIVPEIKLVSSWTYDAKAVKAETYYNEPVGSAVSGSIFPTQQNTSQTEEEPAIPASDRLYYAPDDNEDEDADQPEDDLGNYFAQSQKSSIKRIPWLPPYTRKRAFYLFKRVVHSDPPEKSFEQITEELSARLLYQLKRDMVGSYDEVNEATLSAEMVFARKNMTSHFAKLIRFSAKLYKEKHGRSHKLQRLEKVLSKSIKIATIVSLYRYQSFGFFVSFMRKKVFVLEKVPELIIALNIRPCEKYVMLAIVPGFVYALNHPEEYYTSWNMQTHSLMGYTSHIVREIQQDDISYEQIMERLMVLYEKINENHPYQRNFSKYNNLSYHYRTRIEKVMRSMLAISDFKRDWYIINSLDESSSRSYSIEGIRELLAIESVRKHLLEQYIQNKQLIVDILEDPNLSCHSKKIILQSYPKFAMAVECPTTLNNWHD